MKARSVAVGLVGVLTGLLIGGRPAAAQVQEALAPAPSQLMPPQLTPPQPSPPQLAPAALAPGAMAPAALAPAALAPAALAPAALAPAPPASAAPAPAPDRVPAASPHPVRPPLANVATSVPTADTSFAERALTSLLGDDLVARAVRRAADPDCSLHSLFEKHMSPAALADGLPFWRRVTVRAGIALLGEPALIESLWRANRASVLQAVARLDPAARKQLERMVDDSVYALSAFLLDPEGTRLAVLDETVSSFWKRGVIPGTSRPADAWLLARTERLQAAHDKVQFAADLWRLGGEPLLTGALKLTDDLRAGLREAAAVRQDSSR